MKQWLLADSKFFCSCGREFLAYEVNAALKEVVRATQMIAQLLEQQYEDLADIRREGLASFRTWLAKFAEGISSSLGAAAGHAVGRIIRSILGGL